MGGRGGGGGGGVEGREGRQHRHLHPQPRPKALVSPPLIPVAAAPAAAPGTPGAPSPPYMARPLLTAFLMMSDSCVSLVLSGSQRSKMFSSPDVWIASERACAGERVST